MDYLFFNQLPHKHIYLCPGCKQWGISKTGRICVDSPESREPEQDEGGVSSTSWSKHTVKHFKAEDLVHSTIVNKFPHALS